MNEQAYSALAAIFSGVTEDSVRLLAMALIYASVIIQARRRWLRSLPEERSEGRRRLLRFILSGSFVFLATFFFVIAILRWNVSTDAGLELALIASSVAGISIGMILAVIPDIRRALAELAEATRSTRHPGDLT